MAIGVGNRADYYRNNLMFGILPISFACLLYLLSTHLGDLFFSSDWFIDLMVLPGFFGAQLSGASYVGRTMDHAHASNAKGWERVGTWLGLGLGLALGIGLSVIKAVTPFAQPLSIAGDILFTLGTVGAFSGLGNRLGQFVDKGGRPAREKKAMGMAGILGLAVGIALVAAKCFMVVSVVGVTTLMTGGAALPLWIAGAAFVCTFASTSASAADYVSKAASFVKARTLKNTAIAAGSEDELVKTTVRDKFHEYRGSLAGVSTGVIVAGVILGAIIVSQPYLLAGLVGLVIATMVVVSCVSVLGGLFSRVGRMMDAYQFTKKMQQAASAQPDDLPAQKAAVVSSPRSILGLSPAHRLALVSSHHVATAPVPAASVSSDSPRSMLGSSSDSDSALLSDRDKVSVGVLSRSSSSSSLFASSDSLQPLPRPTEDASPSSALSSVA